jgi:hypothetical protein
MSGEQKISRLTGYPYRCNKCGEMDWGNGDRDERHMQWRRKHFVECWGMSLSRQLHS